MTTVHVKFIGTRSQKKDKQILESKGSKAGNECRRKGEGISAGEKAKVCQKGGVDVAYTLWR